MERLQSEPPQQKRQQAEQRRQLYGNALDGLGDNRLLRLVVALGLLLLHRVLLRRGRRCHRLLVGGGCLLLVQVLRGRLVVGEVTVDGSRVVVALGGSGGTCSSTDAGPASGGGGTVAVAVAVAPVVVATVAVDVGVVVGDEVVNPQFLQHQLVAVQLFETAPFLQYPRRVFDLRRRQRHDQELVLALVVSR